jgi:DNA-binding LacI/PurR family transcriptional regulator
VPRKPTILDVARRAGVSKSLVSLVMRGSSNVSDARRKAVLEAARELGYRPNAMARGLVQRRTKMMGVVVSDLHNPFFADVVEGMQVEAESAGFQLLLNSGSQQAQRDAKAIDTFLELRTEAIVLAGPLLDDRVIRRASRAVPVVVVGRTVHISGVDSVTNDDWAGSELVVEHCVALGHREIAHVDGGPGADAAARREGYMAAMQRLGLGRHIQVAPGLFTEEGGHSGGLALMDRLPRPTAIFAANDLAAVGVLNAVEEKGLRAPEDVSIVGYDNTSIAALRHVSLTTVHQPRRKMGKLAVTILLERLEQGRVEARHVVLPPRLVVRGTTSPPSREAPETDGQQSGRAT